MTLVDTASLLVTAAALVAGAFTTAATRRAAVGLAVALELGAAAGLLRLSADGSWRAVATAGAILALRMLVGSAVAHPLRRRLDPLRFS